MSQSKSPEAAESSSSASFRSRSSALSSSYRSNGGRSSQKAAELRARYEMAQALQKPWPLHLLENGVKPNTAGASTTTTSSGSRSTRPSTQKHTSSSSTRSSSSRRDRTSVAATHAELTSLDVDAASRSNKKRNSSTSDKLSLSPTLSNWIRRASKDSDKSCSSTDSTVRDSSAPSSSHTSPMHSPKDL